jgi:hypothetical protein
MNDSQLIWEAWKREWGPNFNNAIDITDVLGDHTLPSPVSPMYQQVEQESWEIPLSDKDPEPVGPDGEKLDVGDLVKVNHSKVKWKLKVKSRGDQPNDWKYGIIEKRDEETFADVHAVIYVKVLDPNSYIPEL